MRQYQMSTNLLIKKTPFERLCREILLNQPKPPPRLVYDATTKKMVAAPEEKDPRPNRFGCAAVECLQVR
jgi:histone H3/H4